MEFSSLQRSMQAAQTNSAALQQQQADLKTPSQTLNPLASQHVDTHLSDNLEEISMSFSEKEESKGIGDREITDRPNQRMRVQKIMSLYHLMEENSNGGLTDISSQLRRIAQNPNFNLDDVLSKSKSDPALANLALQHAIGEANKEGKTDEAAKLNGALDDLMQHEEHGAKARAGINTAAAIAAFSKDPKNRAQMRDVYYAGIAGKGSQGSLIAMFDALLSRFDEKHFNQGIHVLINAMNDDLNSSNPSKPKNVISMLLKDMTASQDLNSVLNQAGDLLRRMKRKGADTSMTAARLTRRLLDFTQSRILPRDVKQLTNDCAGGELPMQMTFMNALKQLLKDKLPVSIWGDDMRAPVMEVVDRVMADMSRQEQNT
ncbi:HrpJ domain-containing protein [Pokkaliibacter sp. CJK22405]|uniref:HrpJ domain-containing protein n=1 Tax=Pokkaliibacter sp. CJK22405 TaxID=3384615 RepID=UPI003984C45A